MKKKILLSLIVLSSLTWPLKTFGQNDRLIMELELLARDFYSDYLFHMAQPIYEKLDSIDPGNPNYLYPLGVCYLNQKNDRAADYFEQCLENADIYPDALYFYSGKSLHYSHRFDEAIQHFSSYLELLKSQKNNKENRNKIWETEREIDICKTAKSLVSQPLDITIHNLSESINSPYPDYAPVLSADEKTLLFTSERPNTTGGKVFTQDGYYNEDIYISTKQNDGSWSEPKNMGDNINTAGQDAAINISPDGHFLLIYHYNTEDLLQSHSGNLYFSELEGDHWTKPEAFPKQVNSKHWESSASMSADDRTLFFTSNRPGGYGGSDIYSIKKNHDGTWGKPVNLGPEINSKFNEESPYIHPDGKTLYFCSNGHKTMGGFDIFVSKKDDSTHVWSEPKNIGYPINTAHDDIYFSWNADGRRVYFSSIRDNTHGNEDIYYADMHHLEEAAVLVKSGTVIDAETKAPLACTIEVVDNNSHDIIGTYYSNSSTGKYTFIIAAGGDYSIHFMSDDHHDYEYHISDVTGSSFKKINNDVKLKPNY